MNRHILFFIFTGLQANVTLLTFGNSLPRELRIRITEEIAKDVLNKKIDHLIGNNNLDEQECANLNKFKNICSDNLTIFINKYKSSSTNKKFTQKSFVQICINALAEAKQVSNKEMFFDSHFKHVLGGLPYLLKGFIKNDVFNKMEEILKQKIEE